MNDTKRSRNLRTLGRGGCQDNINVEGNGIPWRPKGKIKGDMR